MDAMNSKATDENPREGWRLEWIACLTFVGLGIPDAVLGVAWPSIAKSLACELTGLGYLVTVGFIGYLSATLNSLKWVHRFGLAPVLIASSGMVIAMLLAIAWSSHYAWLIVLAFLGGVAGGSIDTSINAFASARFSGGWVNAMHGCWGIGASLGPTIMTTFLTMNIEWRWGYRFLAANMIAILIAIVLTRSRWREPSTEDGSHAPWVPLMKLLRSPPVWWMMTLYFIYTAIESATGYLAYSYLTLHRQYSVSHAGYAIGAYWFMLTIGRLIAGSFQALVGWPVALRIHATFVMIATLGIVFPAFVGCDLMGVVLLGLGLAPLFPTWISKTSHVVAEEFVARSIGLQIGAAAIGVATLPAIVGQGAYAWGWWIFPAFLCVCSCLLGMTQEYILRRIRTMHPSP